MGNSGFFYLSFSFPVGRADAISSFADGGSYASAFGFVVFYGCALVFGREDTDVVSCFEEDVFGVDCAAFDCQVFFGNDGSCLSSGDPASSCFFGNGFRMVLPSGAAEADILRYCSC